MGLVNYYAIVRRWWWLLSIGLVLAVVVGYLTTARATPLYEASTRLFVNQVQAPGIAGASDVQASEHLALTYTQLLHTAPIMAETIKTLNLPMSVETLQKRTKAQPVAGTQLLELAVTDPDPQQAWRIADGLSAIFVRHIQELQNGNILPARQQVDLNITNTQQRIADTQRQLDQIRGTLDASNANDVEQTRLQQQIAQYEQDARDSRSRIADASSRLNDLTVNPNPAESRRLTDLLAQYNKDLQTAQQRSADAQGQLDHLRATPPANTAAATTDTQRLQNQLTQLQDQNRRLLDTRQTLALAQQQGVTSISVVQPALVPTAAVTLGPMRNGAVIALLIVLITVGIVLLLDMRDDRIHEPKEIRKAFDLPIFATLGAMQRDDTLLLTNADRPNIGQFREGMRALRTHLAPILPDGCAVVCVSSANAREGKSMIAANLALVEAQAGKHVVLVDASVREPGVHRLLGLRNDRGLSAYLEDPQVGTQPKLQDGPYGIKVLTAGWALSNLPDLLGSHRMSQLIQALRKEADMVIIDSASILATSDTLSFQHIVDGTLLVVDVRKARTASLEKAIGAIEQASGKVLGVILVRDKKSGVVHRASRRATALVVDVRKAGTASLEKAFGKVLGVTLVRDKKRGAEDERVEDERAGDAEDANTGTYGARR